MLKKLIVLYITPRTYRLLSVMIFFFLITFSLDTICKSLIGRLFDVQAMKLSVVLGQGFMNKSTFYNENGTFFRRRFVEN